jgi:hypothetical protein
VGTPHPSAGLHTGAAEERGDASLYAAVEGTGARLAVLAPNRRGRFAQLLWEAAQDQAQDVAVRAEVRRWTREEPAVDGIPVGSHVNAPFPVDALLLHPPPPAQAAPSWVGEALVDAPVLVVMTDHDVDTGVHARRPAGRPRVRRR